MYINTGHEWDGSDSGAAPDEVTACAVFACDFVLMHCVHCMQAVSWGKIKMDAHPVKVNFSSARY